VKKKRIRIVRAKSPSEELANQLTHGAGIALSLVAIVLLVKQAMTLGDGTSLVTHLIFGLSLLLLYSASFFYHSLRNEVWRRRLKVVDHAAIYILIAGTYTPFLMFPLLGTKGNLLLLIIWGLAFSGVVFKIFFAHRFKLASTLVYLAMGWLVLFVIGPLTEALPTASLLWLVAGGLSYTTGVVFYLWDKLPYQHAIWHLFVLGGSVGHLIAVLHSIKN
jgi:hemolysin III